MKKSFFVLFLIWAVILPACKKLTVADNTPLCVKQKIRDFEKESKCSDSRVDEYKFQTETVFVFSPGTCGADMASLVIDSNCNTKGYLGGLSGNHLIEGKNFSSATFVRTIWQK